MNAYKGQIESNMSSIGNEPRNFETTIKWRGRHLRWYPILLTSTPSPHETTTDLTKINYFNYKACLQEHQDLNHRFDTSSHGFRTIKLGYISHLISYKNISNIHNCPRN
ncbi:hypothetical protein TNCV_4531941 [Trichonephila clavipes]|nr:hypothetical protein TNCV_4531941 [Trichonephila clavipes]